MDASSILLVTPWLQGGGIERTIQVKAPWLAARGHRVEVIAWHLAERLSDGPNPALDTLRAAGVPVRRLPVPDRFELLRHAVRVAVRARSGRFRVVVGHELHGNVVALMAKALTAGRLRAIAQVHNEPMTYVPTGASPRLMALARRLYRYADGTVAVAEDLRLAQIAMFGVDPERVVTINNPFPVAAIAAAARAPLDVPTLPYLVACGRLTELKGFADLIRAFASVRSRRPLRLVILGDGPERAPLQRLAVELGVGADVELPGFVASPYAWFGHARGFVLSSRSEGLANVLVEAMICGAPIVSSRCAGAAEVIEDGRTGLLYDPGDVGGLTQALDRLLDDPTAAARRARAARHRAESFSEERILPTLERYYLGQPPAPTYADDAVHRFRANGCKVVERVHPSSAERASL
jgi:glycosyltransferase involved in cell wall biosynthesis